jgi:hypothetical protein
MRTKANGDGVFGVKPSPRRAGAVDETPDGLAALAACKSGLFPQYIQDAQAVLDRAVTGGFFDSHEGGGVDATIAIIKQDARRLLLDLFGPVDVHVVWDRTDRKTRVLAAPVNPAAPPSSPMEEIITPLNLSLDNE